MPKPALLVTGASGKLGRRVVELLLEQGHTSIIAATRTPEKLADLAAKGVEVRQADFEDAGSLAKAFAGAERLLLISTDALSRPDQRIEQHTRAIIAAERAGVRHVLYTSLVNSTDPANPSAVSLDHRMTEVALKASSLDYTILRNSIYAEMLLMSAPAAIASGKLIAATGEGAIGYVTREDCARAAAAVLAAHSTGRSILNITGPEAVTSAELAKILSEISGKPVEYVPVGAQQLIEILKGSGMPDLYARVAVSFDQATAQGYLSVVSNSVLELSGQAPQSIRDFLLANKAALLVPQPA